MNELLNTPSICFELSLSLFDLMKWQSC